MDTQKLTALILLAMAKKQGITPAQIRAEITTANQISYDEALAREAGGAETYERTVLELARKTTSSTSYEEVVSWTVAQGKTGILSQVEFEADYDPGQNVNDYSHAVWWIKAGNKEVKDIEVFQSLSFTFPNLVLRAGQQVFVYVKSDDGTEITVDADITGKEVS